MLILTRHMGQAIYIRPDHPMLGFVSENTLRTFNEERLITITALGIDRGTVKLGISAPQNIAILRAELQAR